jgi:hypothetical protein
MFMPVFSYRVLATSWIAAAAVFSVSAASAASANYDLTGDTSQIINNSGTQPTSSGTDTYSAVQLNLTNTATSSMQLPDLTVHVGDVISGTITLNAPITSPAGNDGGAFQLSLFGSSTNAAETAGQEVLINVSQSATFYKNGVMVTPAIAVNQPSAGYYNFLAIYEQNAFTGTTNPAFSFDKIVFSDTINSIELDSNFAFSSSLTSADLSQGAPSVFAEEYSTVVPIPAAGWMMLSGIACLGLLFRRRSVASPQQAW